MDAATITPANVDNTVPASLQRTLSGSDLDVAVYVAELLQEKLYLSTPNSTWSKRLQNSHPYYHNGLTIREMRHYALTLLMEKMESAKTAVPSRTTSIDIFIHSVANGERWRNIWFFLEGLLIHKQMLPPDFRR